MKSTLLLLVYLLVLSTATRIPTDQKQKEIDSVTSILATSSSPLLQNSKQTKTDSERIQLDLCDCQPATGEPGGLSCDKEGFFIASFERQGQWVAGGGSVPLSRAVCCRPCLPTDLPDDSPLFDNNDKPLALVSMGCHASTDPLGVRCEADNTNSNSFVSGFTSSVHVFSSVDTQYPVDTAQCCTPALLMESGDAWELERCDCGVSTDPEHSVSCSISGGGDEKNTTDITLGSILSGFDFFRISPLGQIVPIGPAKCCGVCLTGKIHPAADCRDLNHCSGNGVCLLGRCECLQGWGSPDCSQSLAGRSGKIPPWAITLIVIGSCLIAMIVLSAAAHVAELVLEARSNRRGGSDSDDEDGDESRRPFLLLIDADDAGSVGSQDTEGCGDEEDNEVLMEEVEERIDQVIHRLEESAGGIGTGGSGNSDNSNEQRVGGAEEGSGSGEDEESEHEEEEDEIGAGSSVPSSSFNTIDRGTLAAQVRNAAGSDEVRTTEEGEEEDNTATQQETPTLEKPAAGAANSHLESYTGIGPLSGVDCVCATFSPKTCVHSKEITFRGRQCHPQTCDFDADEAFKCGFPETGEYTYRDAPESGCEDPFMTTTKRGPSQCGERCCRGDHIGDFKETTTIPGTANATQYEYQPTDNDCRYESISRGQILHYLHSRGSPLVVIGDSLMRQFFLRLVMMMRGQQRLLDYHLHAHAQYAVCREADSFRISTSSSNISGVAPNNAHLRSKAPSFFRMGNGPGRFAGRSELQRCTRKPTEFHYMHAPKWRDQAAILPEYFNSLAPGVKPVLLTSVGYWEGKVFIPDDYLDALDALKDQARKVFIVSVPTVRVPTEERRELLRHRNNFMKNWVEQRGEPYAFIDFDALSIASHPPPGGSDYNWHYMCSVVWRIACTACDLVQVDHSDGVNATTGERVTPPQILKGNIERIHGTEDGMCVDEMNRNLWQVVFNVLLKPAHHGGAGSGGRWREQQK